MGDDPFVAACLKAEKPMLAVPPPEGTPLRRALGGHPPARTLLVPMVIRDRLAGLLCADELPGEEGRLNEAALEVLTFVTGLSVDLLAARKKIPSPALTPRGEEIAVFRPPSAQPDRPSPRWTTARSRTPSARPAARPVPPLSSATIAVPARRPPPDRTSAPLGVTPDAGRPRRPLALRADRPERRAQDPADHGRGRGAPRSRGVGLGEEEGGARRPSPGSTS